MGSIGIGQLLLVVVIVVLLFGTKKLGSLGSDLGASIKGFKKAMSDEDDKQEKKESSEQDADFVQNSLTEKQSHSGKDEAKRQDKEQV